MQSWKCDPIQRHIVRLSLGILTLIPPPLPVPLSELICGRNGKEWWSKISHIITPGWQLPFYLSLLRPWLQHSHVRKVLVTSGKHTRVTPKKPMWSRRGRLLAISCSFEFLFCSSVHAYACIYLHGWKLTRKTFLEIDSRRVFWATKIVKWSKQHRPDYGHVLGNQS